MTAPDRAGLPSTIALFGSGRRNGNTGQLLDAVARLTGIEIVDVSALSIAPYDYDHSHRDDDFEPLIRHVVEHDQLVFASPVYWDGASAPLKAFLDRISYLLDLPDLLPVGRRLRGKTAFVLCTSVNEAVSEPFQSAFRETFAYLGMHFGGLLHLNCRNGFEPAAADGLAGEFARLLQGTGQKRQ